MLDSDNVPMQEKASSWGKPPPAKTVATCFPSGTMPILRKLEETITHALPAPSRRGLRLRFLEFPFEVVGCRTERISVPYHRFSDGFLSFLVFP